MSSPYTSSLSRQIKLSTSATNRCSASCGNLWAAVSAGTSKHASGKISDSLALAQIDGSAFLAQQGTSASATPVRALLRDTCSTLLAPVVDSPEANRQ